MIDLYMARKDIMRQIYCDEAGFTGPALLDAGQPFFAYSAVAITNHEAEQLLNTVKSNFALQMPEIKGSALNKSAKGKRAALSIMEQCIDHTKMTFLDKKFSLAGKFYEYMFEFAAYSHKSSNILYEIGFAQSIANLLYYNFVSGDEITVGLMRSFENALRSQSYKIIEEHLKLVIRNKKSSDEIKKIARLCLSQRKYTLQEWNTLKIMPTGKWILDLTDTSLDDLLTIWGATNEALEVYCDDSKPILASLGYFDNFIGRTERYTFHMAGKDVLKGYNLTQSIQLISSKMNPAMQIADVFASSLAYALNNPEEDFSKECRKICDIGISDHVVMPNHAYIDIYSEDGFINAGLLHELVDRKMNKKGMFKDLRECIVNLYLLYPRWIEDMKGNH
jgi:hypothetical protein